MNSLTLPAPGHGVCLPARRAVPRALFLGACGALWVNGVWLAWLVCWIGGFVGWEGWVEFVGGYLVGAGVGCGLLCLGEEAVRGYPTGWRALVLAALVPLVELVSTVSNYWAAHLIAARCTPFEALEYVLLTINSVGFWTVFPPSSVLSYLIVFLARALVPRPYPPLVIATVATASVIVIGRYHLPVFVVTLTGLSLVLDLAGAVELRFVRRWRRWRRRRRAVRG